MRVCVASSKDYYGDYIVYYILLFLISTCYFTFYFRCTYSRTDAYQRLDQAVVAQ
jgi:hypothetical protein